MHFKNVKPGHFRALMFGADTFTSLDSKGILNLPPGVAAI